MAEDPESGGEKTEDPTGRKLSKAREEGQVAKSIEIPSVFVLIGGVLSIYATAGFFYQNFVRVFRHSLQFEKIPLFNIQEIVNLLVYYSGIMLVTMLPVFLAVIATALVTNFAQVGFEVSWKSLEPKFSRMDPINGFKQKFTSRAVVEFVKTLLKIAIVGIIVFQSVKGKLDDISVLYDASVGYVLLFVLKTAFWIFIKVCLVMIVVAILDYAYQKWKFLDDQKMTKKELKDETKQTEGDPVVKSRIRQLQHEAARKRMMAAVPEADVVVTNPTRLAVALKYDGQKMDAPTILAKGAGPVAANIRRIAEENDVPIVEDKPLAQNLYSSVEVGEQVPMELYQAVAELLAYVYKLKGKTL